jgi:hypothetical protein
MRSDDSGCWKTGVNWTADFSPLEIPDRPSGLKIRGPGG